jgi:uncharacterized protein YwbE
MVDIPIIPALGRLRQEDQPGLHIETLKKQNQPTKQTNKNQSGGVNDLEITKQKIIAVKY